MAASTRTALAVALLLISVGTAYSQLSDAAAHRTRIDSLLQGAVDSAKIPGGVLWLEQAGQHYHKAYGSRSVVPSRTAMDGDTIFDAASLTKVMATAPSITLLIERRKIRLRDRVQKFLPSFKGERREDITIEHLLTHTSGLPPVLPRKPAWTGRAHGMRLALTSVPTTRPGKTFRYSDINFILLGEIVQAVSGQSLDRFARTNLFIPMGMKDTSFNPPAAKRWRIAPTTREAGTIIRGTVHDPAARAMGGATGHAGLFTSAPDLARYARMLVNGGTLNGKRIMSADAVRYMTRNHSAPLRHRVQRGLGWDIDSSFSSPRGEGFPRGQSYGHTGWTGGSIWIHPESKSFVIFLCNRNHPHERRTIKPLREQLGTLAGAALGL